MRAVLALLLLSTTAHADFVTGPRRSPLTGTIYAECAVIRVTPKERVEFNPGYKVNVTVYVTDGNVTRMGIVHTLADGTRRDRSQQYDDPTISWGNNWAEWKGWRGQLNMTGTMNINADTYTEVIRRHGDIETTIRTRCHHTIS